MKGQRERWRERGWGEEISTSCLLYIPWPGIKLTTLVYTLTGNWIWNLLVYKTMLQPMSQLARARINLDKKPLIETWRTLVRTTREHGWVVYLVREVAFGKKWWVSLRKYTLEHTQKKNNVSLTMIREGSWKYYRCQYIWQSKYSKEINQNSLKNDKFVQNENNHVRKTIETCTLKRGGKGQKH